MCANEDLNMNAIDSIEVNKVNLFSDVHNKKYFIILFFVHFENENVLRWLETGDRIKINTH